MPVPDVSVSVMLPPAQNVVGPLAVITGAGVGLIVTLMVVEVSAHPAADVTSTEYVPVTVAV